MITCQWENGDPVLLRHAVVDVLAVKDDKILLVYRSAKILHQPNKWSLPGGYIDRDETISQAALRELREETGYEGRLTGLFLVNGDPRLGTDRQNISFFYLAEALQQAGQPDWETAEVRWFPLDALPPDSDMAFDTQIEVIDMYKRHLEQPMILPVMKL
jgi:ADP-ribose pyrophosphatase YjhB (NUDIX family)